VKSGVAEALELLLRRLDDSRVRVADVQAADAAGEVDERVAVDVGERRSVAFGDYEREADGERIGDYARLALENLLRTRPGNGRLELDRLRGGHPESRYSSCMTA